MSEPTALLKNPQKSAEIVPSLSNDVLKFYEILRDHIRHEDTLINQRISWSLLYQGFAIVAYTAMLNTLNWIKTPLQIILSLCIIWIIGIFSISATRVVLFSVARAYQSIENLKKIARKYGFLDKIDLEADKETIPVPIYTVRGGLPPLLWSVDLGPRRDTLLIITMGLWILLVLAASALLLLQANHLAGL